MPDQGPSGDAFCILITDVKTSFPNTPHCQVLGVGASTHLLGGQSSALNPFRAHTDVFFPAVLG